MIGRNSVLRCKQYAAVRKFSAGFSLIELSLVLFIIALAAQLGVRELSKIKETRLTAAANRQLDEIAAAVCNDSAAETTGFLCDMGRLPLALASDDDSATLSLRELYEKPENIGELKARPATKSNLVEGTPYSLADDKLMILCGWGGPYVKLPQSAKKLRDPWGNPFENANGAVRLFDASGIAANSGSEIAEIRHLGSDGEDDAIKSAAKDSQKDAKRRITAGNGGVLITFPAGAIVKVNCYEPRGDKIAASSVSVEAGASQLAISGITPGIRFLKAIYASGEEKILQVRIRPGRDTALVLD